MKYIIEIHREYNSVDPVKFVQLLSGYLPEITSGYKEFQIYETVNHLHKVWDGAGVSMGTVRGVIYGGFDLDAKNDAYYVSLDVPSEYTYLMHEGRGAFIPKIDNNRIGKLEYVQKGGQ